MERHNLAPDGRIVKHRVVIVGGGFAGLRLARKLRGTSVEVVLIDRRNFHLFQPLLYQVATGTLSPANIAAPLRVVLRRQRNCSVVLGEVIDFRPAERIVVLRDREIAYDTLVVAAGSRYNYFGHDHWQQAAPSLKTLEDATEIRRRVLLALEAAEYETDPEQRRRWLTFLIVGGGPTGVELAGTLAELTRRTFRREFRNIAAAESKICLIEGSSRVLNGYPEKLSHKAQQGLAELGVEVRTGTIVTDVRPDGVSMRSGESATTLRAQTVLWTAGVRASPLHAPLTAATGADADRIGRIIVRDDLTVPGHPEIFVIGDMALCRNERGEPLPGIAPVALQQGTYVAQTVRRRLKKQPIRPFHYRDWGAMATIGRSRAVADLVWFRFSGFTAWLLWLFVHLMQLVSFQNRVLVFVQWAWNYVTFNRSACLITGDEYDSVPIPNAAEQRKASPVENDGQSLPGEASATRGASR